MLNRMNAEERYTRAVQSTNLRVSTETTRSDVAWKDDSQVCVLRECRKGYSDTPRVLVTVEVVK